MKLVALRGEEPPDDAVVVVRAGANGLSRDGIARTADRSSRAFGFLGVSVFLAVDHDVGELCRRQGELQRYGQVSLSTVGRVRGAGFPLLATGDRPHFDIVLPDLSVATLDRLAAVFDPPQPNPGRPS